MICDNIYTIYASSGISHTFPGFMTPRSRRVGKPELRLNLTPNFPGRKQYETGQDEAQNNKYEDEHKRVVYKFTNSQ